MAKYLPVYILLDGTVGGGTHNVPVKKETVGGGAPTPHYRTTITRNGTHDAPREKGTPMAPLNGPGWKTGGMGRRGAAPYGRCGSFSQFSIFNFLFALRGGCMLKRVGILTLYAGSCNYGGVLQAYGLCALAAREGGTPRQILYRKTKTPGSRLRALCKKNPKRILLRAGQQVQTKVCDRLYHVERDMANRRGAFDAFKKAYIPDSGRVYHPDTIPEAVPEYDLFICGSDQVWNPNVVDDAYFLRFVPEGKGKSPTP